MSVVIPCFNYARFLTEAVDSALSQRGVHVDVIIVDDASTDESLAVAERLAAGDPRVHVLANQENSGPVATFNRGLAAAGGEFLVRLDADDLLTPGSLSRAVAVMQYQPSVGLVYGHPIHFDHERPPARTAAKGWLLWKGDDWLAARCEDGTNVITSPEVLMRRSVINVVGGQRALAHTHDMEMWLRIAAHSDVAYVLGVDQAWHREHSGSLSEGAAAPVVILREIDDAFVALFDGTAPGTRRLEHLLPSAHRAVALQALRETRRRIDRRSDLVACQPLVGLASEVCPSITETAIWRRTRRDLERSGRGSIMTIVLVRRARRRVRELVRKARWTRSGMYERLTVSSRGAGGHVTGRAP
ncbi:glycosyltransferase family 2 protein [Salana multivorans]